MKPTTNEWLTAAEDDLIAAQKLKSEERLTNLVAFHCQQCIEKCFKALIEEQDKTALKSHDLFRLQIYANFQLDESDTQLLGIINEVYIDARYPGDMGLMPSGKPTLKEVEQFILFSKAIFDKINDQLTI
jgi:HEPN domain-containing protein